MKKILILAIILAASFAAADRGQDLLTKKGDPSMVGRWGRDMIGVLIDSKKNDGANTFYLEHRFRIDGTYEFVGNDLGSKIVEKGRYRLDGKTLSMLTDYYTANGKHVEDREGYITTVELSKQSGATVFKYDNGATYQKGLVWDFKLHCYMNNGRRVVLTGSKTTSVGGGGNQTTKKDPARTHLPHYDKKYGIEPLYEGGRLVFLDVKLWLEHSKGDKLYAQERTSLKKAVQKWLYDKGIGLDGVKIEYTDGFSTAGP